MPAPPTDNLRVVKYAAGWGYSAAEWERALRAIDWTKPHAEGGPERLKIRDLPGGSRDASVWRATLTLGPRSHEQRHEVVLKVEPLGSVRKKVQALLRRTKAFRQWRGAAFLARHGVRAAAPLAVLRSGSGGPCETLVLESVPGPTLLERITAHPALPERRALAAALVEYLIALWRADAWNADGKPSNLIATPGDGHLRIAVVDTVAIRYERIKSWDFIDDYEQAVMLRDLILEPTGVGATPSATDMMRVFVLIARGHWAAPGGYRIDRHAWRKERNEWWRDIARMVVQHGDPTPKHDPLARG